MKSQNSKKTKLKKLLKEGAAKASLESSHLHAEHHRFYKAQQFVIEAAYTKPDENIQVELGTLLPDNTLYIDFEKKVLRRLFSRNKSARATAIEKIWDLVLREWGITNELVLLHPKTIDHLTKALRQEVLLNHQTTLINILGHLHTRGFRWIGIYNSIAPFFKSSHKELVKSAIRATQHMSYNERWKEIFPLISKYKSADVMNYFFHHCRSVPANLKSELVEVLGERYNSVRGKSHKRKIIGAIWLVATNKRLAQKIAKAFDWKDTDLLQSAAVWKQLEPNKILEKEVFQASI